MKLKLIELKHDACKDYIYKEIEGIGHVFNLIAVNDKIRAGRFFVIAPTGTVESNLYNFQYGGQLFSSDVPIKKIENIIVTVIENFVNKDDNSWLILEDHMSSKNDDWINSKNPIYYLADKNIVYLVDKGYSREDIVKYYRLADAYPFMLLLSKVKINTPVPQNSITQTEINELLDNLQCVFFQVYDKESFLIWVNDREDECLKEINLQIQNADI